jgi:hypothetical protein
MTIPGENTRDLNEVPLNIRIPAQLKERLEAYCADNDLSQASATRSALNVYLTAAGYPRRQQ